MSTPSLRSRIVVAACIAGAAGALSYSEFVRSGPGHHSDFSQLWFGARAMLAGENPYQLIGPGRAFDFPWLVMYPPTAFVAAAPLSTLPDALASSGFVMVSTFLLALGITQAGWHRLPLFLSVSFVLAARAAQVSPLLAAGLCLPRMAALYAIKPNIGIALLAAARSRRAVAYATLGAVTLTALSLFIFPEGPKAWVRAITASTHQDIPLLQHGGPVVLLALLRWRRPDARLLVALACVPQTVYWYEGLYLLLIPATFRESLLLSLVSSIGFLVERTLVGWQPDVPYRYAGELMIAFLYLPALVLVLLRKNEHPDSQSGGRQLRPA